MEKKQFANYSRILFIIHLFCFSCICLSAQDLNPANWPHLKGYWKFQNANQLTKATVGNDLSVYGTHQVVPGPAYGDTAARIGIGSYYRCYHTMAPNGGGDSVNQYTLMFDFKVLSLTRWHTFHQTDTTNTNDGECFIKPRSNPPAGAIGVGYTSYSADTILPNKWYRLMISINLGHYYNYYLNGSLIHQGDTDEIFIDKRFALTPMILFFADNNQEDDTIDIASVAIFDTCLSASDIASIGSIDPCVVNPPSVNLGADTALCSYQSFTKNAGSGFTGYLWSTGETTATVNLTQAKLGAGQHNVWVRVTDINGCRDYDTMSVNYMVPPVVNLGTDKVFCEGLSTTIVAGTSTSNQYLWKYLPSGDTLSTSRIFTIDSTGRYVAIVTSAFGCVSSDTINVLVNPNPLKPIITVTGKTAFCRGDSVKLEGPASYSKYTWTNGSKLKQITIKVNDTLNLKVTDKNGCESPFSDSVFVSIFDLPTVPVIQVMGDTTFCNGDSVLLRASITFASYNWSNGGNTFQQIIKTTGKYSVIVTDFNGCVSPSSRKVTVTNNPLPPKPLISVTGQTTFCDGDSVILSATAGYAQYNWQDGAGNALRTEKQSGTFYVFVKDANNCISPVSDSVKVTVNPNPPKPSIIVNGDTNICSYDTAILTAPAGYKAYLWSDNSTNQTIAVNISNNYRVRIENSFGCKSVWSEYKSIFVYPAIPKPKVDSIWQDSLQCSIKADTYKWYRGNTLLPYSTRSIKAGTGYYKVQAGVGKCWSEISDSFYIFVKNIAELNSHQSQLIIYPNPANTIIYLRIDNISGSGTATIKITDIQGRIVKEVTSPLSEFRSGTSINIPDLSEGIYLVKVVTSEKTFSGRIQKF